MYDKDVLETYVKIAIYSKTIWYIIAIIMFIITLFTEREVFALLALVAAMMKKD